MKERLKKGGVAPEGTLQTRKALKTDMSVFGHKSFTTKPKLRRLVLHKQQTVRTRACALQESFYPTTDVPYAAVRKRMMTLLGICDKSSVLAYLGRPRYETVQEISHTKKYKNSGKTIPLTHTLRRTLREKLGYIDTFDLGSVYSVKDHWFICWNHKTQLTLHESSPNLPLKPSSHEGLDAERSKVNFSLSLKASKNDTHEEKSKHIVTVDSSSSLNRVERNCDSESKQCFHGKHHSAKVKVIEKSESKLSPETSAKIRALKKKWELEDGIPQGPPTPPTEEHWKEIVEIFGKNRKSKEADSNG